MIGKTVMKQVSDWVVCYSESYNFPARSSWGKVNMVAVGFFWAPRHVCTT